MHLALTGIFRAHWSAKVHDEWMRNLLKNRPELSWDKLERTRQLMEKALPDAMVVGFEPLIPSLELPDRDDRHVLAAAIHCGADVIVTANLGHFPRLAVAHYGIHPLHPDDFVMELYDNFPDLVVEAANQHRASLRNPAKSVDEYLAELYQQGLSKSVNVLRGRIENTSTSPA
jgi:hypothetical protein